MGKDVEGSDRCDWCRHMYQEEQEKHEIQCDSKLLSWREIEYRLDILRATKGARVEVI
jgi:hypothetical protein